ncbi:MAG: hypothetical protein HOY69_24595 [Streptomyces sp.]|nr:hypothetical protein [Streptomyces sp.]
MNQPQPLDLDAIQARCDAATPGPWHVEDDKRDLNRWVTDKSGYLEINFGYLNNGTQADARFVAHARTDVEQLTARVRELEAENLRLRTAWHSAKTRASNARERLDIAEHGRDCAGETIEQLQATLDLMPRCNAPHPVADDARCELIVQHPGWHAAHVGAWPHASWPYQTQT